MTLSLSKFTIEKIILTITFFIIAASNLDIYVSYISAFYAFVMLTSFFFKNKPFKKVKSFSIIKTPLIIGFYLSLLLIPNILAQHAVIFMACLLFLIIDIYFTEDGYANYGFFIISLIQIISIYLLVGATILLIFFVAVLLIIQILTQSKRKIYSICIVLVFLNIGMFTNTQFSNFVSLYMNFDFNPDSPYMSEIGSSRSRLVLPNKVIFTGQGQTPNDPYFYSDTRSNFIDYIDGETKWQGITYIQRDNNIVNLARNINHKNHLLKSGYLFVTYDKWQSQNNFYFNKNIFSDDYFRSFSHTTEYFFREKMSFFKDITQTRDWSLFQVVRHDSNKFLVTFKPQFLSLAAIPVVKKIEIKTPLHAFSLFPANVISIIPENKNFTAFQDTQSLVTVGKKNNYQALNVTYLDSIYVQYRSPFPEDFLLSGSQRDMIAKIAPEIGINKNDSVYQKVYKIHKWFANNFTYSLKLRYNGHGRTLEDFLLRDRKGHCEYFATATALILRYYNIPSQYATGIVIDRKGEQFSGNKKNGHAWNLYWDGAGWIKTDNTVTQLDNNQVRLMKDIFSKNTISSLFKNHNLSDTNIKNILKNINIKSLFIIISSALLFFVIIFLLPKFILKRFPKYFFEQKLKKELRVYLKKYPKESHIPWGIWAKNTKEPFCINKVEEYYKTIYPL